MTVLDAYPWLPVRFRGLREESGGTYCRAECPLRCHTNARCRFWLGSDGRLMFGCWAGCSKLEILRAVGLTWKDTYAADTDPCRVTREITARYPYRDEQGVLLYETVRLEPGRYGRDKDFLQRRPDPARRGGWDWSLGGVRRVLYRLPELIAAPPDAPVLVVAGEKDVESCRGVGLVATTNVCGERAEWLDSYSACLDGRHVVVIEDRDATGRRHAHEVCGSLLDHAASVRRTRLPAKDATAFFNELRCDGVTDRATLKCDLLAVLSETRTWVGVDG